MDVAKSIMQVPISRLVSATHNRGNRTDEWSAMNKQTPRSIVLQGYGTLLMEAAERIAAREHRSTKLAVISGVGTRHYYRKVLVAACSCDSPGRSACLHGLLAETQSVRPGFQACALPSRVIPEVHMVTDGYGSAALCK